MRESDFSYCKLYYSESQKGFHFDSRFTDKGENEWWKVLHDEYIHDHILSAFSHLMLTKYGDESKYPSFAKMKKEWKSFYATFLFLQFYFGIDEKFLKATKYDELNEFLETLNT